MSWQKRLHIIGAPSSSEPNFRPLSSITASGSSTVQRVFDIDPWLVSCSCWGCPTVIAKDCINHGTDSGNEVGRLYLEVVCNNIRNMYICKKIEQNARRISWKETVTLFHKSGKGWNQGYDNVSRCGHSASQGSELRNSGALQLSKKLSKSSPQVVNQCNPPWEYWMIQTD